MEGGYAGRQASGWMGGTSRAMRVDHAWQNTTGSLTSHAEPGWASCPKAQPMPIDIEDVLRHTNRACCQQRTSCGVAARHGTTVAKRDNPTTDTAAPPPNMANMVK